MTVTITEALAELKLITSKVEKKKAFILMYLSRQEGVKDPFEKTGGSSKAIAENLQSIQDLSGNFIKIRSAIAKANAETKVEVCGISRTVADWLVWRRNVAPMEQGFQKSIVSGIQAARQNAHRQNLKVVISGEKTENATDVIIELDEKSISEQLEKTQEMLDKLDGKLSLHNATTQIAA